MSFPNTFIFKTKTNPFHPFVCVRAGGFLNFRHFKFTFEYFNFFALREVCFVGKWFPLIQFHLRPFYQFIFILTTFQYTMQSSMAVSGVRGREYRPKETRLVIYLKNVDLCYVDAWGCSEIVELLLQLVQRQGFYNDSGGSNSGLNAARNGGGGRSNATTNNTNNNSGSGSGNSNLEWINVSGLQICGSISQTTTAATANASLVKIAPRYLAINHMLHVGYPTQQDMLGVIQRHLEHLLLGQQHLYNGGAAAAAHFKGLNLQNVQYIAEGLMEFYTKVCIIFVL